MPDGIAIAMARNGSLASRPIRGTVSSSGVRIGARHFEFRAGLYCFSRFSSSLRGARRQRSVGSMHPPKWNER